MLRAEDGNTLYDVRNRLRHATILTTERRYDHFETIQRLSVCDDIESFDVLKVSIVRDNGFVENQPVSGDDRIGTIQVFETVRSLVFPPESSCSAGDMIVE